MKKLQTGDAVIVIAGKDRGTQSTITTMVGEDRVIVKGVNTMKKAVKGEGHVEQDMPIHISNVMHYDADAKSPSRVGIKDEKGKKVRYYKKSGKVVG